MKTVFTDAFIKNIKQAGRFTDAATSGLNFNVKSNGGGYWVFRYLFGGKRLDLSLGAYPAITLKEARKRAIAARNDLLQGIKPKAYWRVETASKDPNQPLFKDYARECIEAKKAEWQNSKHIKQWFNTIDTYANPIIGKKFIDEIDTQDILDILTPIWYIKTETASRLRGRIEWILASATTRKLRNGLNPASWRGHLETILPKPTRIAPVQHHPALPYKDLPEFIKILREKDGIANLALEFLILNANRSGEVLNGLRSEISDEGLWVIPAERMKAKKTKVTLASRYGNLREIRLLADDQGYVSYRQARKAQANCAGDYYPGLDLDRCNKTARVAQG
jgi:hypothetical protein